MNRYNKYKSVSLPWINEIPKHWEIIRNKNIFVEKKKSVGRQFEKYKLLSLSLKGVIERNLEDGGKFPASFEKYTVVNPKDLVFCLFDIDETPRTIGISKIEGMITSAYNIMAVKKDCAKYMYYFYLYLDFIKGLKPYYSSLRKTVNIDTFNSFKILIPPINEQEQIANYLDWKINEIDRLIQVEKEKIKELKRLTLNIIAEFVLKGINTLNYKKSNIKWIDNIPSHWNEISIRGCVNIIRGNSSFTKDDLKNQGEYVGLQYGKVYKTEIIDSKFNFYVSDKFYKTSQVVTRNDIIIVSTSETVEDLGHTSFYDRDDIGLIGGEQILLRPLNNIDAKYLLYLSKIFRHQLQLCATGIKVYRFKINDLKQLYIPLPPIEEQENIVSNIESKLKQLDERVKNHYDLIKELELLKQSLISEVVIGKMDVRNVVIPEYEKVTLLDDETEEFDEMEGIEDGN